MTQAKQCVVNGKISDKIGGCVIVMIVTDELSFDGFLWFGNSVGELSKDVRSGRPAKHTKGDASGKKAERQDSYFINKGQFKKLSTWNDIVDHLMAEAL